MKYVLLTILRSVSSACVPAMVTNSPGAYGRVTDAQTHAPLAHASVSFPGRGPTASIHDGTIYRYVGRCCRSIDLRCLHISVSAGDSKEYHQEQ